MSVQFGQPKAVVSTGRRRKVNLLTSDLQVLAHGAPKLIRDVGIVHCGILPEGLIQRPPHAVSEAAAQTSLVLLAIDVVLAFVTPPVPSFLFGETHRSA